MAIDTKTALLNSAERAARAFGFDGFSYADLAKDVGIRKASIHHHFPSKSNLSVELMRRYYETVEELCADIDASKATGGARLMAVIDLYRNGLSDGKALCLCVSFSASPESLPPEVIGQIGQFRSMMIDWMTAAFQLGKQDGTIANVIDPAIESAALMPMLEGAQLAARAKTDVAHFDSAIELLSRRLTA